MKVAAVAALAVAALAFSAAAPAQAQNLTDTEILNFALNLEYLEAEFYSWAANGEGIPEMYRGGGPASTGGMKANLTGNVSAYAAELAQDELNHVIYLRTALGSAAVPMPEINIGTAFASAANAAFNMTLSPAFSPYANNDYFLLGAFIFEDVGVTAYKGAAALITNKTYLTPAAGILAVEAYHAGLIRSNLYSINSTVVSAYKEPVSAIVDAIAALRATASNTTGVNADDRGVTVNGTCTIVDADANSIAFSRTPAQVISVVTLGGANSTGGFFPMGLNMASS